VAVAEHMIYGAEFFECRKTAVSSSCSVMVPMIYDLFRPSSIVDVGCGQGDWLRAFLEVGANDVLGLDGSYVDDGTLVIPADKFLRRDLTEVVENEFDTRFDLVLCLEVAEHLPETAAGRFVRFLTSLGDVIVFSAAVPGQTGVGHINCQWPPYWIDLFADCGYWVSDPIRSRIWQDSRVAWWYQQNTYVFAASHVAEAHPVLSMCSPDVFKYPTLVHPQIAWKGPPDVPASFSQLKAAIVRSMRYRLNRIMGSRVVKG
jgi:SAM-dependent methyltransferase